MKERDPVSEAELRQDEANMEREKYARTMSIEEIISKHASMENIGEGLCYLSDTEEKEIVEAVQSANFYRIGVLVHSGLQKYILHCLTLGSISEYVEDE